MSNQSGSACYHPITTLVPQLNAQCTLKKTGGLIVTYSFACSWPVTLDEVWFSQHNAMYWLISSSGDKVLIWFRTKTLVTSKKKTRHETNENALPWSRWTDVHQEWFLHPNHDHPQSPPGVNTGYYWVLSHPDPVGPANQMLPIPTNPPRNAVQLLLWHHWRLDYSPPAESITMWTIWQ